MKGMKINVNFQTGERAGNVDPKSTTFKCHPAWQDSENGLEIRVCEDHVAEQYRGRPGVVILEDEAAIEAELQLSFPTKTYYKISNQALIDKSINALTIDVLSIPQEATQQEELEFLYNAGCRGIVRKQKLCPTPQEVYTIVTE